MVSVAVKVPKQPVKSRHLRRQEKRNSAVITATRDYEVIGFPSFARDRRCCLMTEMATVSAARTVSQPSGDIACSCGCLVSDIAIFVLKRDVKLQLTLVVVCF